MPVGFVGNSNEQHAHAHLHRRETTDVPDEDDDIKYIGMVQTFKVHDESSGVGAQGVGHATFSKKMKWHWQICAGRDRWEDWVLTVADDSKVKGTIKVVFTRDGVEEYNDLLRQDWSFIQGFRGTLPDMHVHGAYEVFSMDGHGEWFPATLNSIRHDGRYSCRVKLPIDDPEDERYGEMEDKIYPVVDPQFIRKPGQEKPAQAPGKDVLLEITKADPYSPKLKIGGLDWHEAGFVIPIPRPGQQVKDIEFKVDKNYEEATCEHSYSTLKQMCDNVVMRMDEVNTKKEEHSWTMNMGAAGEHKVSIGFEVGMLNKVATRMSITGGSNVGAGKSEHKEFILKIDGDEIIKCSPNDFGKDHFEVTLNFRFMVKCSFAVYELEMGHKAKDSIVHRDIEREFDHLITIYARDHTDLKSAQLTCDRKEFSKLPKWMKGKEESGCTVSLEQLENEFGIRVPKAGTQSEGFQAELMVMWEEFKEWVPHDKKSFHHFLVDVGMMCGCRAGQRNHSTADEVVELGHGHDHGVHWKESKSNIPSTPTSGAGTPMMKEPEGVNPNMVSGP